MISNFCQIKTAFLLPVSVPWAEAITSLICDEDVILYTMGEALPDGWELIGVDISGLTGFVLLFEISKVPTEEEMHKVVKVIEDFGLMLLKEKNYD